MIKTCRLLRLFAACVCASVVFNLAGCVGDADKMEKRKNQTLCGIVYSFTSGTMMGADVYIKIYDGNIEYAEFYSDEKEDFIKIENEPINQEKWETIKQKANDLVPQLTEYKEKRFDLSKDIYVMDGGDEYEFRLIWRDGEEEIKVRYNIPNSDSYYEFLKLVKEMVCEADS